MHTRKQFWNQGLNTSRAPMWSHLFGLLQALPLKWGWTSYQVLGLRLTPSCPNWNGSCRNSRRPRRERGHLRRNEQSRFNKPEGPELAAPSPLSFSHSASSFAWILQKETPFLTPERKLREVYWVHLLGGEWTWYITVIWKSFRGSSKANDWEQPREIPFKEIHQNLHFHPMKIPWIRALSDKFISVNQDLRDPGSDCVSWDSNVLRLPIPCVLALPRCPLLVSSLDNEWLTQVPISSWENQVKQFWSSSAHGPEESSTKHAGWDVPSKAAFSWRRPREGALSFLPHKGNLANLQGNCPHSWKFMWRHNPRVWGNEKVPPLL